MYVGNVLITASTLDNWVQDFGNKPGFFVLRGPEAALVMQSIVLCTMGTLLVNCVGAPRTSFLKSSSGLVKMRAHFKSKDQHIDSTVFSTALSGDHLRASDYDDGTDMGNFDGFHSVQEKGRFIAAYGPYRQLQVCMRVPELNPVSKTRIEPIFRHVPLTALGFADMFSGDRDLKKRFQRLLKTAVTSLAPHIADIEVKGTNSVKSYSDFWMKDNVTFHDGRKVAATNLTDKDQSLLAWVADMIGHFILDDPKVKRTSDMMGLVLVHTFDMFVDTLEESELLRDRLGRLFPKVQFIVTSAQVHKDVVEARCVTSYPLTTVQS